MIIFVFKINERGRDTNFVGHSDEFVRVRFGKYIKSDWFEYFFELAEREPFIGDGLDDTREIEIGRVRLIVLASYCLRYFFRRRYTQLFVV